MSFPARPHHLWKLRTRELALGGRTLVMGVLNVTPDSFSDGGQFFAREKAVYHALAMLEEGADILDIGGESTRPGKRAPVTAAQEQERVLGVIEGVLATQPEALISIDTYKAETARAAVAAGAEIVNDVSGFLWDPAMAAACAELGCGVVLMHTRGRPEEWRTQPALEPDLLISLMRDGLAKSLQTAHGVGISADRVVLDPGYGLGKRFDQNYALLARQAELLALGRPLLAGLSRKSFLTRTLSQAPGYREREDSRETASVAALVAAILHGASIVRVHEVRAAVEAAAIADAVLAAH